MVWTWRKTRVLMFGMALLAPLALAVRYLLLPDLPGWSWQTSYERGTTWSRKEDYRLAEWHLTRALRQAETLGPDDTRVASTLQTLAKVRMKQDRHAEAEQLLARALAIREKLYGPKDLGLQDTLYDLSKVYFKQQRWSDAVRVFERLRAMFLKEYGPRRYSTLWLTDILAGLCGRAGKHDRAIDLYDWIHNVADGPEGKCYALRMKSFAYREKGDYRAAESAALEAMRVQREELQWDARQVNRIEILLAQAYSGQRRYDEAVTIASRVAASWEAMGAPDNAEAAHVLGVLATVQREAGNLQASVVALERAIAITEAQLDPDTDDLAHYLGFLGMIQVEHGSYAAALPILRRALSVSGGDQPPRAVLLFYLSASHYGLAEYNSAVRHWGRAIQLVEESARPELSEPAGSHLAALAFRLEEYARILRKANRQAEATRAEARARAIRMRIAREHPDADPFQKVVPILPP